MYRKGGWDERLGGYDKVKIVIMVWQRTGRTNAKYMAEDDATLYTYKEILPHIHINVYRPVHKHAPLKIKKRANSNYDIVDTKQIYTNKFVLFL